MSIDCEYCHKGLADPVRGRSRRYSPDGRRLYRCKLGYFWCLSEDLALLSYLYVVRTSCPAIVAFVCGFICTNTMSVGRFLSCLSEQSVLTIYKSVGCLKRLATDHQVMILQRLSWRLYSILLLVILLAPRFSFGLFLFYTLRSLYPLKK